jgi:hypothetical protein
VDRVVASFFVFCAKTPFVKLTANTQVMKINFLLFIISIIKFVNRGVKVLNVRHFSMSFYKNFG